MRRIKNVVIVPILTTMLVSASTQNIICQTTANEKLCEQKLVVEQTKRKEEAKKKAEAKVKAEKEKAKKAKKQRMKEKLSKMYGKKVKSYKKIKCTLSFYTDLACENGGYAGITASGKKLTQGYVANNELPFGTGLYIDNYGSHIVQDRGCSNFDNIYRYDVFIPRNYGESDSQYLSRVNNMGKKKVTAYIIKFEK